MVRGVSYRFGLGLGVCGVVLGIACGVGAQPRVAPPSSDASLLPRAGDDQKIQRAVVQELQGDRHLLADNMTAEVHAGIVELGGATVTRLSRDRAERVTRIVSGVRAVVNRVRIITVTRDDDDVARDVRRALLGTAALAEMPIAVRVSGGVVDLAGRITSWEEQQLAERVASSIPGVRFCQNRLSASLELARTEAVLAGDVRSRLAWDPLVQHDPLQVVVHGTRVVLTGTTGSHAEAHRALTLGWVKGVTRVDVSGIRVDAEARPDPRIRLSWPRDDEIAATIQELARYWPGLPIGSTTVSVLDGRVTLTGNVPTVAESHAAEAMAGSAVGVVTVDNQLKGPWWRPPIVPPPPPRRRAPHR